MNNAADAIVSAARVHTMGESTAADAVAIAAGRVIGVGARDRLVEAFAGPDTRSLHFPGATIVPGLVDAHTHPIYSLGIVRGASLVGITGYDQLVAALEAAAPAQAGSEWFFAWGLDPNAFDGRPIGNQVLHDVLGPDRPAYVKLFDAHSAVASSAALERAGITRPFTDDSGASVVDDGSGGLSGHLLEFPAMDIVEAVLPVRTFDDRVRQLHELLGTMAARGVTSTHVMDLKDADALDLLAELERRGDLPVRLRLAPWCEPGTSDDDLEELVALQGRGGRRFRVEGIKLFIDGTVEGGTAWLDTPDADGEGTASTWADPDAYAARIRFFHAHGIATATHAIGERGIRFVAETLAALPPPGPRHRIEHIESVDGDVIERMAASGIAASMQPTHCTQHVWPDGSDDWSRRLGPDRARRAWLTADVRRAGGILALGSDWPVADFDPWPIMADARLRRPVDEPGSAPIRADQALSAREALEGYTTHAHRSVDSDGGTLEVGAVADLAVVDTDPLTATPEQVAHTSVLLTLVEGRPTHEAAQ
ncbi:MAG: amidohydrolase family protein [Protaetiibacter sp.]